MARRLSKKIAANIATLEECREEIQVEINKGGPYSHNIIGIILRIIDGRFGKEAANQTIEDLGLDDLGWSKQP